MKNCISGVLGWFGQRRWLALWSSGTVNTRNGGISCIVNINIMVINGAPASVGVGYQRIHMSWAVETGLWGKNFAEESLREEMNEEQLKALFNLHLVSLRMALYEVIKTEVTFLSLMLLREN
jgi:hypothetical protein